MKKLYTAFLPILLLFMGCINSQECQSEIEGRYYCYNDTKAINYIEINVNGTFMHIFRKDSIVLTHNGKWKKNKNGYCYIELSEWKNFNENGNNYTQFGNGILYVNDKYLDISPDGESSASFVKK